MHRQSTPAKCPLQRHDRRWMAFRRGTMVSASAHVGLYRWWVGLLHAERADSPGLPSDTVYADAGSPESTFGCKASQVTKQKAGHLTLACPPHPCASTALCMHSYSCGGAVWTRLQTWTEVRDKH